MGVAISNGPAGSGARLSGRGRGGVLYVYILYTENCRMDYGKRSLSVGVVGEAVRLLEESGGFSRGLARQPKDLHAPGFVMIYVGKTCSPHVDHGLRGGSVAFTCGN